MMRELLSELESVRRSEAERASAVASFEQELAQAVEAMNSERANWENERAAKADELSLKEEQNVRLTALVRFVRKRRRPRATRSIVPMTCHCVLITTDLPPQQEEWEHRAITAEEKYNALRKEKAQATEVSPSPAHGVAVGACPDSSFSHAFAAHKGIRGAANHVPPRAVRVAADGLPGAGGDGEDAVGAH